MKKFELGICKNKNFATEAQRHREFVLFSNFRTTLILIVLLFVNLSLFSKSKNKANFNISVPQFSAPSSNGISYPLIAPGLNPYFYNNPAYGNLLLNQSNTNFNAINSRIGQPESDLGSKYLDAQIQKEITEELTVQPLQSGSSMPVYRITNIIDHGRADNTNNPKFKNVDYLLWKFQNLEEGISIQFKGDKLEFGQSVVFVDKPDSILDFVQKQKDNFVLLESRANGSLTGFLVNSRTKKVSKIQANRSKDTKREIYEYTVVGEEKEFWNYIDLSGNRKE